MLLKIRSGFISYAGSQFLGFGAYQGSVWFAGMWPEFGDINVAIKEFIPIVIAAEVWGLSWSRKRILFKSVNSAVVAVLKSGLCRDRHLAYCLRELAIRAVLFSFTYSDCHIPGQKIWPLMRCPIFVAGFQVVCPQWKSDLHLSALGPTSQAIISTLDENGNSLLLKAWAPSTIRSYSSARHQFIGFCNRFL